MPNPIEGTIIPPGDKSISHRAILFAGLNRSTTRLVHISHSEDVQRTLALLEATGRRTRWEENTLVVEPIGQPPSDKSYSDKPTSQLSASSRTIDAGNSGTTARLGIGYLTGVPGHWQITGDRSLQRRPMSRITDPLALLGAHTTTTNGHLPVSVIAEGRIGGVAVGQVGCGAAIDVVSAQVHCGLMLAGLRSELGVRLRRCAPMRDHSLRIARAFGFMVSTDIDCTGCPVDYIAPGEVDRPKSLSIPGDFSSAVFMLVAALLVPGSHLVIDHVGLNPTRTGLLRLISSMGGDVQTIESEVDPDEMGGEPVGRIVACGGNALRGVVVAPGEEVTPHDIIDELPLIALLGACAHGVTEVRGASDLRTKESDRIAATVQIMRRLGAVIEELPDGFRVNGPCVLRGGVLLPTFHDHRIAMLGGVAGLLTNAPVDVENRDIVSVSYPDFWRDLSRISSLPYSSM